MTFTKHPLNVAIVAALSCSVSQATASDLNLSLGATDSVEQKVINKDISSAVNWNAEWIKKFGDFSSIEHVNISAKDGTNTLSILKNGQLVNDRTVHFTTANLTVKGGSLENNGTLHFNEGSSLVIDKPSAVNNQNGKIVSMGKVTIEDSGFTSQINTAPIPIAMGNIELDGENADLTNNDKGYLLSANGRTRERVTFGDVVLKNGADFIQGVKAIDCGDSLTMGDGSLLDVKGNARWEKLTVDGARKGNVSVTVANDARLEAREFVLADVTGADRAFKDFVSVSDKGNFEISDALTIKSFANANSSMILNGADSQSLDALRERTKINVGSIAEFTQDANGKVNFNNYNHGSVSLTDFDATVEIAPKPEEGKEPKPDKWTYRELGDVTVFNNVDLKITDNRMLDKSDERYHESLSLDRLNFKSTKLKMSYKLPVETVIADAKTIITEQKLKAPEGIDDWTSANIAEKMGAWVKGLSEKEKDAFLKAMNSKIDAQTNRFDVDKLAKADSKHVISGSDLKIREITFEATESEYSANYDKLKDKPVKGNVEVTKSYDLGTHCLTINDGSRVEVGYLSMSNGELTVEGADTKFMVGSVNNINGTLNVKSGFVSVNGAQSMKDMVLDKKVPQNFANPMVEINQPLTLGENAKINIGANAKGTSDKEGAQVTFDGQSTLKFDAKDFKQSALFTAKDKRGTLTATNANVAIEAKNLSWGVYKLFDNFDTVGVTDQTFTAEEGKLTAGDAWKDQVAGSKNGITVKTDKDGQVMIVVGSDSIEGSGIDVNAKNLVSTVFKGDRASSEDLMLVNEILSSGSSLEEISDTLNSVTGLGAVSGVKALTVDFAGYTVDQIEHHATTMPRDMGGWWAQPLAARLKTDDLAIGGSNYGYSLDTIGIMGGRDWHVGDVSFGIAGSYQSGDADSEGSVLPVTTELRNKAAHLWFGKTYGETYVVGTLSYVKTKGDATMSLGDKPLSSKLEATAWSLGVRAERAFEWGDFKITPHVGARMTTVELDDYQIERDNKTLFDVKEDKATIFEVPVGISLQTPTFMFQTFTVQPYADLTIRGRFGDTESSYDLKGSKTVDTINYDVAGDFVGDLKLGYMSTYKNLNLGLSYGLSAGDGGRQNHALEATMRVDF